MRGRYALAGLVAALVIAAVLAVLAIHERPAPQSPVQHVPTTWRTARETPMHVFHVGTKKIACRECHEGGGGEDAAPTAASCAKCHDRETKHGHLGNATSETTCLSCHVFGGGERVAQCADCHANGAQRGAPPIAHHAGGDVACGACHAIHGEAGAVLADCTSCHATVSAIHGRFAAHPAHPAGAEFVNDFMMNAEALASLREAGASAGQLGAEHRDGGSPMTKTSVDPASALPGEVCSTCHAAHSGKELARASCTGCHVSSHGADGKSGGAKALETLATMAPRIAPGGPRVAGHDACITCHDPHRAKRQDAKACDSCHADRRAAASVKGHTTCTGCHAPHAPSEARRACGGCHGSMTTLSSSRVPAHADCTSCHDAHQPKTTPEAACIRCHDTVRPSHPPTASSSGAGKTCTGCHAPHRQAPGNVHASAATTVQTSAACSTCHTSAKDDRAFHAKGTTCTQCHAPHAFRLAAGAGAGALCAKCHAAKATAATGRPGHADCEGCHGPAHTPAAKPSCRTCHAAEASSTTKGHVTCTSCHDAHSGALGARAACTSCHENKKKAVHASSPQVGTSSASGGESCATCHRAHGPNGTARPPTCASCHARSSLVGLHGVAAHASCETCHSAHGPPRSDRATCTSSCHANQRDHQPEAKVCNGCHVFRH